MDEHISKAEGAEGEAGEALDAADGAEGMEGEGAAEGAGDEEVGILGISFWDLPKISKKSTILAFLGVFSEIFVEFGDIFAFVFR